MKKFDRKVYNRNYMRQYRGLKKDCSTCKHLAGDVCKSEGRVKNYPIAEGHSRKAWHCCNWKKSIVISIKAT